MKNTKHIREITNTTEQVKQDPFIAAVEAGLFMTRTPQQDMSNMIERQERRGAEEVTNSEMLPTENLNEYGEGGPYAALGFKIGAVNERDPLFTRVELPPGWSKRTTDHAMWNDIVDDKGRKRASFFYKAAFYDRSAHMSAPITRYRITMGTKHRYDVYAEEVVIDTAKAVYDNTGAVCEECILARFGQEVKEGERSYAVRDKLRSQAQIWLDAHYPEWKDFTAYWD